MRHVQRLLTLLFEPHTIYQNRDQTPPCVVHTHNMSSAKVKITLQNPIEHSPDPNIKAKVNATSRTATTTTKKPSAAHSKYGRRFVGHEVYMYIYGWWWWWHAMQTMLVQRVHNWTWKIVSQKRATSRVMDYCIRRPFHPFFPYTISKRVWPFSPQHTNLNIYIYRYFLTGFTLGTSDA